MFENKQKLKTIFWSEDEKVEVGEFGCLSITVVMENGQMAPVPWFVTEMEDGSSYKYNGAHVEGIQLLKE